MGKVRCVVNTYNKTTSALPSLTLLLNLSLLPNTPTYISQPTPKQPTHLHGGRGVGFGCGVHMCVRGWSACVYVDKGWVHGDV